MLRFGIVGIAGRPRVFLDAFERSGQAVLAAVCDKNEQAMADAMAGLDGVAQYTDYETMLDDAKLDAVIIGTPMPLHVPQSIAALERGIHVYSEVTAGISIDECRELAAVCRRSRAQYMLGENCCFFRANMIAEKMVLAGALGEVFYAEGEYNHDCRELITLTPWRKTWLYDVPGITYGTHALGPILRWIPGDRVCSVTCATGGKLTDKAGAPLSQDAARIMLCRTEQGRLIKIKQNLSSPRPYGLNFFLECSRGTFSSCTAGDEHRDEVWLDGMSSESKWDALADREAGYVPELWAKYDEMNGKYGHTGADVITMIAFIRALAEGRPVPIGFDAAMDMTLPGLISQTCGESWAEVPDSREWQ